MRGIYEKMELEAFRVDRIKQVTELEEKFRVRFPIEFEGKSKKSLNFHKNFFIILVLHSDKFF